MFGFICYVYPGKSCMQENTTSYSPLCTSHYRLYFIHGSNSRLLFVHKTTVKKPSKTWNECRLYVSQNKHKPGNKELCRSNSQATLQQAWLASLLVDKNILFASDSWKIRHACPWCWWLPEISKLLQSCDKRISFETFLLWRCIQHHKAIGIALCVLHASPLMRRRCGDIYCIEEVVQVGLPFGDRNSVMVLSVVQTPVLFQCVLGTEYRRENFL